MPTYLLIGHDEPARIQLLDQLAAIAELNPVQIGDLRSFEADWRGVPLRVETVVTTDLPTIVARAELADFLVPVIAEVNGPMPRDREQLAGTPPRLEVPAVFCVAPVDDAEVQALVHLEATELIRENRPRWVPRFVHTDCRSFMFLLARSFFTDCLGGWWSLAACIPGWSRCPSMTRARPASGFRWASSSLVGGLGCVRSNASTGPVISTTWACVAASRTCAYCIWMGLG